jgi:hypothetical protein
MMDAAQKRGVMIAQLEAALALADELNDGKSGYLIERALDEARAQQFRLIALIPPTTPRNGGQV